MNMYWSPILTLAALQRGVFEYNPTAATANKLHYVCMFYIIRIILYVTIRERERERERERILIC